MEVEPITATRKERRTKGPGVNPFRPVWGSTDGELTDNPSGLR